MVSRGYCGLLAALFCGVTQAATPGLFLDAEPGAARSVAGHPAWRDMPAFPGQLNPEPARESSDFIDRSGNSGVRGGGHSFDTASPLLNAIAEGGSKSPIPETEDPVPEPFGAILIPPVVGRRRLI